MTPAMHPVPQPPQTGPADSHPELHVVSPLFGDVKEKGCMCPLLALAHSVYREANQRGQMVMEQNFTDL